MDFDPQAFVLDKKKEIVILLVVIIVLFALYFMGRDLVTPKALETSFSKNTVSPGSSTVLTVMVSNVLEEEVHNASVTVKPESSVISVSNSTLTEEVIGVGSSRKFDFTLRVSDDATLGSYGVTVVFDLNGQEFKRLVHFQVSEK